MNIWVLTNEYENKTIGGLGTVATHLSKALAQKEGIHVTVLASKTKKKVVARKGAPRVVRFPLTLQYFDAAGNFKPAPIAKWLRTNGYNLPDLIHTHSLQCVDMALYFKRKYGIPFVYTCHSLALRRNIFGKNRVSPRQVDLFRFADVVTVPSAWQKRQIHAHCPYVKHIQVIRNGVPFRESTTGSGSKKKGRLLFVGRLTATKGINELLQAVGLLKKSKPKVKLDIVGRGSATFTKKLKQTALRSKINQNVRWIGKLKHEKVQRLYSSYQAVIVPSRKESFGLVALEAMASGVPLVATRNGGLSSFVNRGNATIIASATPRSIAAGIRKMWKYPDETAVKAENAKKTAKQYSWTNISDRYAELFYRVTGR
ncbi:glycosyltransferase family 4 protein [Paenibacillus sp. MSJ-34]|uniref:glycosyltransferase family 4 protein n=1 Tax=Paenibacillus sp. MSJ-34 TaxID=2841529 RepID=UPI001C10354B|nr:glycosyltransferase family 4 protein [Paenibacillus sp. MSJ-34]MBU5442345.1 glycosyltransferase family 4 protein [Paenibacillus sp. MSJ-34]